MGIQLFMMALIHRKWDLWDLRMNRFFTNSHYCSLNYEMYIIQNNRFQKFNKSVCSKYEFGEYRIERSR